MRLAMFWTAAAALALGLPRLPAPAEEPLDNAKEEAAVQKTAEAFVDAFNAGDAKALAALFTEGANMVDPEGRQTKGRKAIEDEYTKVFADSKGAKLFIRISSLRVVRPDLALEDGTTEVVAPDGGPPSAARYSVVHVKQDGKWLIESVHEAVATPPNNAEHFEGLAYLIGNWTEDVEKGGSAKASYAWYENKNFIVNTFDVTMKDVPVAGGKQVIAWDESIKKPRAFSFFFNGGFAESVWTRDGEDTWRNALAGTQRDGKKVTATNVVKKIDANHFSFQLIDRTVDGKPVADAAVVKMKRVD